MMTASLAPLRMADLQHLAIPGQKKVPRKGLRFSRFEHSSPAMLWEWEARQPENCCCAPAAWTWTAKEMLLCVVDADCEQAMAMCEELLPHTTWTVDTQHGRHYYYLTTEISSQRIMGGLDRKCGRNVYVVAPGSPGYVQSAEWRHGWPPTLTLRQWMVMEQTWRDQRPEPDALPGGHGGTGPGRKRRRHHNQAGSSNWRSKVQRCELHLLCEGRRNAYMRRVAMSRIFSWRRKDGHFATRARVWNYMVAVNANRFEDHRLSLTEVSQIVTKAMRDARQQYSEEGFHQSQDRKCRRSSVVRGITAQERSAEVRTARMAGVAARKVARTFQLSCRQVSRIAPYEVPGRSADRRFPWGPRGQRGWLMSLSEIRNSAEWRSAIGAIAIRNPEQTTSDGAGKRLRPQRISTTNGRR